MVILVFQVLLQKCEEPVKKNINIKNIIYTIIYVVFSYFYALKPELRLEGGIELVWNSFNLETYIMMLFVGLYLVFFWRLINKLFRN